MPQEAESRRELTRNLVALQPRLLWYIASRVSDLSVQEDLLSAVNERVLQRSVATDIERVESFAFGVARYVVHEYWRMSKRRQATEAELTDTAVNRAMPRDPTTQSGINSRAWLLRMLSECLALLPEADQAIARRCYGDGASKENRAALAEELGVSRNVIDARISRVRAKIERCVHEKLAEKVARDGDPTPTASPASTA